MAEARRNRDGTAEHRRLAARDRGVEAWGRWGPYLAERAWGTVREDYSADGEAWSSFPFEHAAARAFRWNEDGLAGFSDDQQLLCLSLALWNGVDPILKERFFGLANGEGNHGEDVKELYFFTDATPTHSYLSMRYLYPQSRFPYEELRSENATRGRDEVEYELADTGAFDDDRYFDVEVVYAKAAPDDICVQIAVTNRGPDAASLHVLPTVWFRNTWSWGYETGPRRDTPRKPVLEGRHEDGFAAVGADHPTLGAYHWYAAGSPRLLVTENETNTERLWGTPNDSPYAKDAFHRCVVDGEAGAVDPSMRGTKAAAHYGIEVAAGMTETIRLRLCAEPQTHPFAGHAEVVAARAREADEFYASLQPGLDEERAGVQRAALAGLIWSKQLYYYDVEQWLAGDPTGPSPPPGRGRIRNGGWTHVNNFEVILMPDTWEYPWFAAWDLAFHCVPMALIDPVVAKDNLRLMTREWCMHPNGQLPAYEWGFDKVNPPVFAWATRRIYELDAAATGTPDVEFLEGMFHKLLLEFTWWVNRKDVDGNNVFQGGFLGLDNISLFDRSEQLPTGGHMDQSDGTAWMAFFTLGMLKIALELARVRPVYQDVATKFYEHFLAIARAMSQVDHSLWDPVDGFFYDVLHLPDGSSQPVRVRSLVGLVALLGVEVVEADTLAAVPDFRRRMRWFSEHKPHLVGNVAAVEEPGAGRRHLLSILDADRLRSVLQYLLDPNEFLSEFGIRSLSKAHEAEPYVLVCDGQEFTIAYEPGDSTMPLFGGNSNWRGPIWFPLNYLIIEALREYGDYYGPGFEVEYPVGSGRRAGLHQVADDLSDRLIRLFESDAGGARACDRRGELPARLGGEGLLLFHEFFHGDTGAGLGASHQTGWTALVAKLIDERRRSSR